MDSTSESKVIVPYRWCRFVSEHVHPSSYSSSVHQGHRSPATVYYTSPSGRVLLSRDDVRHYFRESHSCKCYIDQNIFDDQNQVDTFVKTFNFDPSLGYYMMPPPSVVAPGHPSPCLSWVAQIPTNVLARELEIFIRKLRDQLVHKRDDINRALYAKQENNHNKDAINGEINRINLDEMVISSGGRIFLSNLSSIQFKHLLYECVKEGAMEPPMDVSFEWLSQVLPEVGAQVVGVKSQSKPRGRPAPIAPTPPSMVPIDLSRMGQPVPESKIPAKLRPAFPKIIKTPSHALTNKVVHSEKDDVKKKAARRERQNRQSRIKRANETPEQRTVRLEKQRTYNRRHKLKRRLSQMQEEEELVKMEEEEEDESKINEGPELVEEPEKGGGAPAIKDKSYSASKNLKV